MTTLTTESAMKRYKDTGGDGGWWWGVGWVNTYSPLKGHRAFERNLKEKEEVGGMLRSRRKERKRERER